MSSAPAPRRLAAVDVHQYILRVAVAEAQHVPHRAPDRAGPRPGRACREPRRRLVAEAHDVPPAQARLVLRQHVAAVPARVIPWRSSVEAGRGGAAATTWIVRGGGDGRNFHKKMSARPRVRARHRDRVGLVALLRLAERLRDAPVVEHRQPLRPGWVEPVPAPSRFVAEAPRERPPETCRGDAAEADRSAGDASRRRDADADGPSAKDNAPARRSVRGLADLPQLPRARHPLHEAALLV